MLISCGAVMLRCYWGVMKNKEEEKERNREKLGEETWFAGGTVARAGTSASPRSSRSRAWYFGRKHPNAQVWKEHYERANG